MFVLYAIIIFLFLVPEPHLVGITIEENLGIVGVDQ